MSPQLRVEATGADEREAREAALRELKRARRDLDPEQVRYQLVEAGERGLLGVGAKPALVVAVADVEELAEEDAITSPATAREAHPDQSPAAAAVRELLELAADAFGADCRVIVEEDDERIRARCEGGDPGLLIGRHGQTIDALQQIAQLLAARAAGGVSKAAEVDAGGYRERRRQALTAQAEEAAERAIESGQRQLLEPMSAVERKLVHEFLKERGDVATESEGDEPHRFIVVLPAPGA